jgi:thiosulfate reductase cytochrome b subunit
MRSTPFARINRSKHRPWVKTTHWIGTLAFLVLLFTGYEILMVHPRLYWGNVGNDLTPALIELPISRNYHHGGWENTRPFFNTAGSPVSSSRTYDIFNQNGWGRSLHFLSGWFFVAAGLVYLLIAIFSGHIRRNLWPAPKEFSMNLFFRDFVDHLLMRRPPATPGSKYGLLQKISYFIVLFFLLPVIILTGLTMSPAITAACPFLLTIFFGAQSARTIHFFASFLVVLFLIVHIVMVIRTGFKQQMRSMTFGK